MNIEDKKVSSVEMGTIGVRRFANPILIINDNNERGDRKQLFVSIMVWYIMNN